MAFTGSSHQPVSSALEEEIGVEIMVPEACQYTGALGAALLALESG